MGAMMYSSITLSRNLLAFGESNKGPTNVVLFFACERICLTQRPPGPWHITNSIYFVELLSIASTARTKTYCLISFWVRGFLIKYFNMLGENPMDENCDPRHMTPKVKSLFLFVFVFLCGSSLSSAHR
jgi:hypothetical protein